MLKYFLDNDFVYYSDKENLTWKEAIQESSMIFLNKGIINETYIQEIIDCVEKHGPYIVIIPDVAMPHSSENSAGVFGTGISFTKMKSSVLFESEDGEDKHATLFFTLAAKNPEEHMTNIQNLSELLMTDGLVEDLLGTNSLEDYKKLIEKYPNV